LVELLEELQVREAQPDALNPGQDLARAGAVNVLGGIELELAGADKLNGMLS
jgi:hypothetical protein